MALGRKRIALIVVAFIAVALVVGLTAYLVTRSSDSSSTSTTVLDGTGSSTFDSFDQTDGDLAGKSTPEGDTWNVPEGAFTAQLGVVMGGDAPVSLAILDLGAAPQAVTTEIPTFREGAGLVFRYRDPSNYWSVTAAPAYGTWNISRVVDGKLKFVGNTGLGLSPNTTLEVRLDGPAIRVRVNSQQRASLVAGELQQATGVGFVATDKGSGRATWTSIGVLGR